MLSTSRAPCYNAADMDSIREVEHTADLALNVQGHDLGELLVNAARGMSTLLNPDGRPLAVQETRECTIEALDAESLLVEWLSELAYWAEAERFVCSEFEVHNVSPTHLRVTCRGIRVSALCRHIKGVTYHNLKIEPTARGLEATVVFDI
jgi:SHS2 domain-containing protein